MTIPISCNRVPVILLALAVAHLLATPLKAQVETTQEGVVLNFQNVELVSVLTALGQAAGINVVSSNVPSAQVTLRTASAVPPENLPDLIRELAYANGLAVIDEGDFLLLQGPVGEGGEAPEPRGLYIHRLEHARAMVLAGTLQALFGGAIPQSTGPRPAQTLSQQLQAVEIQSAQTAAGLALGNQGQVVAFQGGGGELEGNVLIVPDEVTNSLLIRATENDWDIIEQAIQSLDLRPLHVVIEVVIAEVRRSEGFDLGTSFTATDAGPGEGESTVGTLPDDAAPAGSFTLQILRTGDLDVDATLSALSSSGNVRILSRPVIQAQNNVEARILVGSERPFVQVSQTLANDVGAFNQVVQYRDVGTALTILPTINEDGYVNLVLTQEVSSATAETQFGAPIISTREATTQLLALSGQTVVIGGLLDQQTEESRSGIPLLKDIPVLGFLFGRTTESMVNSELFLFLTPYVVASDEDAERLRLEIEGNVDLLRELLPIRSILPPALRAILPDTGSSIIPDTLTTILPDTSATLLPDTPAARIPDIPSSTVPASLHPIIPSTRERSPDGRR